MKNMNDAIKGCFLASAIGDGFGYPTEFLEVTAIQKKWGPKGLTAPIGNPIQVTDDTQMALAVAKAIMRSFQDKALNLALFKQTLVEEFIRWLNDPENNRAPGMTCLQSCERLEKGLHWTVATAKNSKGCGANMRVTPLGLLYFKHPAFTYKDIAQLAQFQSAVTHAHPTALVASELTAITLIKIIEGVAPEHLIDDLLDYAQQQKGMYHADWLEDVWETPGALYPADYINRGWNDCIAILAKIQAALKVRDTTIDPCLVIGEGWIAEEAYGTALFCYLLFPEDTVQTLIHAVNTKGDSDSIACLAGAFAGAHNGLSSIPKDWVRRLEYREVIEEYLGFVLTV